MEYTVRLALSSSRLVEARTAGLRCGYRRRGEPGRLGALVERLDARFVGGKAGGTQNSAHHVVIHNPGLSRGDTQLAFALDCVIRLSYTWSMRALLEVVWSPGAVSHIWERHRVTVEEVEYACYGKIMLRRTREGRRLIYGRTDAGRYLVVIGTIVEHGCVFVVTARDMTTKERRLYRRGK